MTPDMVNGIFELVGATFLVINCFKLHKDRKVKGIYWPTVAFFATWGLWNLYFYPHLDQMWSFYGGVALVAANITWLGQLAYWSWRSRKAERSAELREKVGRVASILYGTNELLGDIPWKEVKIDSAPLGYWAVLGLNPVEVFDRQLEAGYKIVAGVPVDMPSREDQPLTWDNDEWARPLSPIWYSDDFHKLVP